jgi:succinate dehydrogenase / fumarate reductase flavoprotein subunit/fumarate reductase flavoprotein subunit
MAEYVSTQALPSVSDSQVRAMCEKWFAPMSRERGEDSFALRETLEDLMWEKVGVVRNGNDLETAVPALIELQDRAAACGLASKDGATYNSRWNEAINVVNLTGIAELIARSALMRQESRGAHYRTDFPQQDPRWLKNLRVRRSDDGTPAFSASPVQFTRLSPPESIKPTPGSQPAGANA